jgi:hypothetical protein
MDALLGRQEVPVIGGLSEPSDRELSGPRCPECGGFECDCETDDPRTYEEKCRDEAGEDKMDMERNER